MSSPIFVATFDDGERTRMTTFHDLTKKALDLKSLDLRRGIRLSRAAYRSRTKHEPPAIAKAHFERAGSILKEYDAAALKSAAGSDQ